MGQTDDGTVGINLIDEVFLSARSEFEFWSRPFEHEISLDIVQSAVPSSSRALRFSGK